MKSDSFVSVVVVLDARKDDSYSVVSGVQAELDENFSDYEIVVISQGGGGDPQFGEREGGLLKSVPSVRYIQLSMRVDKEVAWAAGLENAIGDFVVLFDHTEDPVSVIKQVVDISKSGFDVVVGVALRARSLAYRALRKFADLLLRAADYHLPQNATGLRCLSRRAVNAVTTVGRFHHQLYMRIQKTGYSFTKFEYDLLPGSPHKKSLGAAVRELVRLLVFNSAAPLRWMSTLGLLGSGAAFAFAAYSILVHLVNGNVVQGWTTTIFFMSMLFMLQFIMLAFFGEYMGRLLGERGGQSSYSVMFEKNSLVMVNQNRYNVLGDSVSADVNTVQTGRNA